MRRWWRSLDGWDRAGLIGWAVGILWIAAAVSSVR